MKIAVHMNDLSIINLVLSSSQFSSSSFVMVFIFYQARDCDNLSVKAYVLLKSKQINWR